MATTTSDLTKWKIAEAMTPRIFQRNDNLEEFITDCSRFFDLCGLEEQARCLMVKCFLSKELLPAYEAVQEIRQSFDKKIREAFQKPASLIEDFLEIFNYEKNADPAAVFFENVDRMVNQLLRHKWNKEELTAYFLVHCVKENETKREIKMRDAKTISEIKTVIQKVDVVNAEILGVSAFQKKETYANMLKKKEEFIERQRYQEPRERGPRRSVEINQQKRNNIVCWNCNEAGHTNRDCLKRKKQICYSCGKEGHISRECQQGRQMSRQQTRQQSSQNFQYCWGCKEEGHIRSECPNMTCSHCKRKGHLKFQCRDINVSRGHNERRFDQSRSQSFYRRTGIASMNPDDDGPRGSDREGFEDEASDFDNYPKARAPSADEMIGAMN